MDDDRIETVEVRDAPPHDHAVHVYADDLAISQELIRFVEDGLVLGESVVVVANRSHRASLAAWRADHHPPVGDSDFLLVADAAETLETFLVDGVPDLALFEATVRELVERAARGGRTVRVFGEMVGVLWAAGNVAGALALETRCNDMASDRQFFLMCAYPAGLLDAASLGAVNAMCHCHSDLSLLGHQDQFAAATTATHSYLQRLVIPVPGAVSVARQIVKRTLVDWELPHLVRDGEIVISELAAIALVNAESAFRMTLSRDSVAVRFAVEDAVQGMLAPKIGPHQPEHSGLARIETVASAWGCDVTPDGKTVWAELRLSPTGI